MSAHFNLTIDYEMGEKKCVPQVGLELRTQNMWSDWTIPDIYASLTRVIVAELETKFIKGHAV